MLKENKELISFDFTTINFFSYETKQKNGISYFDFLIYKKVIFY